MTDLEMDELLVISLENILAELKEELLYIKKQKGIAYFGIKQHYKGAIKKLTSILKVVTSIEDLARLDENSIGFVFDFLEWYKDYYEVSHSPDREKKDLEEFNKLEELLNLFFDEDENDSEE